MSQISAVRHPYFIYIIKYVPPILSPNKGWLFPLAPRGAGQRAEEKGPRPNSPVFTASPTATSCQIMCPACRTSPKVLPRPPCCRGIALLCWRQPDLPRFKWEVEPNFYKIEKYHDFTWACKSDCYSPRGPKHSCASQNKTVSGWVRVLGGAHGILEMGSLLFMLTVSTRKEDGRFFQLLWKNVAEAFLVWRIQPKSDVRFLVHLCFPTVKYLCFLEAFITASLAQRPKYYRYCHYCFAVRWQSWGERNIFLKFVVLTENTVVSDNM